MERFVLEVPAEPAHVGTVRLFAASLARHHRLPEESVEDVKLGVSEACTALLGGRPDGTDRLRISVRRRSGRLSFQVLRPGGAGPDPDGDLGLEILNALFADAAVTDEESISFSVEEPRLGGSESG